MAIATVLTLTISTAAPAQTRIERQKNSYTPEQDVQLGREAAAQVRRQMPMLDDDRTEDFVERIGERLIDEIPSEFRQPQFRYTFEVVNLREINAFALPGGYVYVNRGLISAVRNEAELAGVLAHEIAHVAERHGTEQATKAYGAQAGVEIGRAHV